VDETTLGRLAHLNHLAFGREPTMWSDQGRVGEGDGLLLYASGTDFPFVLVPLRGALTQVRKPGGTQKESDAPGQ
jgi:hypothetical protein